MDRIVRIAHYVLTRLSAAAAHARERAHVLTQNSRKAALSGAKLLQATSVPAALVCFWAALEAASPTGWHDLSVRTFVVPGTDWPGYFPAVACWPVLYAWVIGKALYLGVPQAGGALAWFAAGAALVGIAAGLNWGFQTWRNTAGTWAVRLWMLSLSLGAFDLFRVAALPPAWDTTTAFGMTYGSMLRAAEIATSLYLVSLSLAVRYNRVRPDLFGAWAEIATPVRWGLIIRGAALVTVLPLVLAIQRALIGLATSQSGGNDPLGQAISWGVVIWCLGFMWALVAGGMGKHLQTVAGLIGQIVKARPPLSEPVDPYTSGSHSWGAP